LSRLAKDAIDDESSFTRDIFNELKTD